MKVSLIITTYNEANNIATLIKSIQIQSELPDEIILVDAQSKDNTVQIAKKELLKTKIPHKVIITPCDRGEGRNIAISKATHEYIIGTDAGSTLDTNWVKEMKKGFKQGDFVMGNFSPTHDTLLQECMGIIMYPSLTADKKLTNASSRSIGFTKSIWQKAGKYPEGRDTGEDTEFNFRIKSANATIVQAKKAIVYWKIRPTIKSYAKMFYLYGKGDRPNIQRVPLNLIFSIVFLGTIITTLISLVLLPLLSLILISLLTIYCLPKGILTFTKTKKISAFFFGIFFFFLKRFYYSIGLVLGI